MGAGSAAFGALRLNRFLSALGVSSTSCCLLSAPCPCGRSAPWRPPPLALSEPPTFPAPAPPWLQTQRHSLRSALTLHPRPHSCSAPHRGTAGTGYRAETSAGRGGRTLPQAGPVLGTPQGPLHGSRESWGQDLNPGRLAPESELFPVCPHCLVLSSLWASGFHSNREPGAGRELSHSLAQ